MVKLNYHIELKQSAFDRFVQPSINNLKRNKSKVVQFILLYNSKPFISGAGSVELIFLPADRLTKNFSSNIPRFPVNIFFASVEENGFFMQKCPHGRSGSENGTTDVQPWKDGISFSGKVFLWFCGQFAPELSHLCYSVMLTVNSNSSTILVSTGVPFFFFQTCFNSVTGNNVITAANP